MDQTINSEIFKENDNNLSKQEHLDSQTNQLNNSKNDDTYINKDKEDDYNDDD